MFIPDTKKYFINTKIDLTELLEAEEEVYIVLKEPTGLEFMNLQKTIQKNTKEDKKVDETALFEEIYKLLPKVVVEHNIYKSENKKMNSDEVVEFIGSKISVLTEVITTYSNDVLFLLMGDKKETKEKK